MKNESHDRRLVVFLKAPVPGKVKTRLAKTVGNDEACAAYVELVEHLLARIDAVPGVELRFSPDDAGSQIKTWLRQGWELAPQGGGDLGARMELAVREKLAGGASRVVLIGSDCPEVGCDDIEAAWRILDDQDVVLGPAEDGGYWLIGMKGNHPRLFEGVRWSQSTVLEETKERARSQGLKVGFLRTLTDVDTELEWRAFKDSTVVED